MFNVVQKARKEYFSEASIMFGHAQKFIVSLARVNIPDQLWTNIAEKSIISYIHIHINIQMMEDL